MRRPLKSKAHARNQVVNTKTYRAPVGGWNSRDALAGMKPEYATKLLNWFPTPVDCVVRGGFDAHAHTITGYVQTLAVHTAPTGTQKMFAATSSDIYNVSSAGAGTDQSLTVTNGKFQWVNFGDGTNNWLIMVNGTDSPKYYDGTNWVQIAVDTTPALSGVTLANLVHVCIYQGRLFFLENSSLSFWYLAAGSAGGALTEFQLDSYAPRGGYLMWVAAWTFDGGSGPDDFIVFMTSEGEAIVYKGTNPSSAATWARVGTFFVGKPLGRKSFCNFAGDLLLLTQDGIIPMSVAYQAQTNERIAITDIINYEFNYVAGSYQSNYGWSMTVYPRESALVVNIPVSETTGQRQFVMNTITKAWCEFDSWDACSFVVFNNQLYFGGDGVVREAWSGRSDNGDDIIAEGRTSFNSFDSLSQQKKVNLFRPMLRVNGSVNFLTGFDVDYNQTDITGVATYTSASTSVWDTGTWDSAVWVAGLELVRKWSSPSDNIGYCVAGKIKINTNSLKIRWLACDYVYETGGIL